MTDTETQQQLTAAELAEIRARAEAATPGPWKYDGHDRFSEHEEWHQCVSLAHGTEELEALVPTGAFEQSEAVQNKQAKHDAIFIAASRTDVPRLLAHIDALEVVLQEVASVQEPTGVWIGIARRVRAVLGEDGE